MQANSALKIGAPVAPLPGPADNISQTSKILDSIKKNGLTTDQVLQVLWGDNKTLGEGLGSLKTLRHKCTTSDTSAQQTRLEVTHQLLKNAPAMQGLANRIDQALKDQTVNDKEAQISVLVNVHFAAQTKIAKSLDNVFFSFVHLASLTVKGAVTNKLSAMFANKAVGNDDAREAAFSKAVNKEARALLASHICTPKNAEVSGPSPAVEMAISTDAKEFYEQFQLLMRTLPQEVLQHENWGKVEQRMIAYFNHTIEDQGNDMSELMSHVSDFPKYLKSMEVSCKLDEKTARKMAFQRDLWNIAQSRSSEPQNSQVTGWAKSYANKSSERWAKSGRVPDVLKPGNQLSLAVDTPMRKANGDIVDVTILSFIGPALDSEVQPEYQLYAKGKKSDIDENQWTTTSFDTAAYKKAYDTIKEQAISYAKSHPDKTEFALTGVGLNAYLSKLQSINENGSSTEFIEQAQEIGARILAELAIDLRKMGKKVIFTDTTPLILNKVNTALTKIVRDQDGDLNPELTKPITLAGKIPGDWIKKGMVIFNAWDTHSLLGNKQKNDKSLDGANASNSLIHPMHALRCAMEAEGIQMA